MGAGSRLLFVVFTMMRSVPCCFRTAPNESALATMEMYGAGPGQLLARIIWAAGMLCPGPSHRTYVRWETFRCATFQALAACRVPTGVTDFWTAWSRLQEFNLDEEAVSSCILDTLIILSDFAFVFVDDGQAGESLPLPPDGPQNQSVLPSERAPGTVQVVGTDGVWPSLRARSRSLMQACAPAMTPAPP